MSNELPWYFRLFNQEMLSQNTHKLERRTDMSKELRRAIECEFKYRASQGRTNYSIEEVLYIVNEVIDEVDWENRATTQEQTPDVDMQIRIIKGDLQYLAEKINKLTDLVEKGRAVNGVDSN